MSRKVKISTKEEILTMATRREIVRGLLEGESVGDIPSVAETYMDGSVWEFMKKHGIKDWHAWIDSYDRFIAREFMEEDIESDANHRIFRYETGAVWRENYNPNYFREALKYPINSIENIKRFQMPDPCLAERYDGFESLIKKYKEEGFFVRAGVPSIWQGAYYYLAPFDSVLTWMASDEEAAKTIFYMMGNYALKSAEQYLIWGVDEVIAPADMGSADGLLFSPEMVEKYFLVWFKKITDLCHSYNAYFHLHSHGHIQELMDMIVDAGIDIIDPVGPSDNNDLAYFKKKWGDKINIQGGLSSRIDLMSLEEMEKHLNKVMEIGCHGGHFMPRTEGGIPMMPFEKIQFFRDTMNRLRKKFGESKN